jgi:catechol 2,3-dioxygenase-like lactoylglutathione lyase family enzyme
MNGPVLGFDHVDVRVPSISAVEPFYDKLMPQLGLSEKHFAFVDERGEWFEADDARGYNTVEYHEPQDGRKGCFIGFIERPDTARTLTRIAFRVERDALERWHDVLGEIGAKHVERSENMEVYPAIFFEDPIGTKLELVARKRR